LLIRVEGRGGAPPANSWMNDPVGFTIPFTVAVVAAPFQIRVGDTAARAIASQQPVKFASMEYVPYTTRGATEWLGGVWYHGHVVTGTGIPVPDADSLLVGSPRAPG